MWQCPKFSLHQLSLHIYRYMTPSTHCHLAHNAECNITGSRCPNKLLLLWHKSYRGPSTTTKYPRRDLAQDLDVCQHQRCARAHATGEINLQQCYSAEILYDALRMLMAELKFRRQTLNHKSSLATTETFIHPIDGRYGRRQMFLG